MKHPPQREMWYPGCIPHVIILIGIAALIGELVK